MKKYVPNKTIKSTKKIKVDRTTYFQKLFCFASFIFLLTCCFWYGGRFIYFYLDNKKIEEIENKTLAHVILNNNDLKKTNNSMYFYGKEVNNYVKYSNLLWRVIKIDNDNSIYLITDNVITYLNANNNYINTWFNTSEIINSGIFQSNLNNTSKYLSNYSVCDDIIDDLNNINCNDINSNRLIGMPSIIDYINTGGENSFINNNKYTYLNNSNTSNNKWYINNEGKLGISNTEEIYGIKAVVKLNNNLELKNGDGTINNPYIFEEDNTLFGSYVKLGNDIWRIYDIDNDNIKLMLNNYLTIDSETLSLKYSTTNYQHNDTITTSLAYYLNNTYLNTLPYKDVILLTNWNNHYYSTEIEYNYMEIFNNKIDTKVSLISIGDIILNDNNLDEFYTNTGINSTGNMIYILNNNGTVSRKRVNYSNKIVPSISINKNILTKGNGNIDNPYEME